DSTFSPIDWILVQLHVLGPGGLFGPYRHAYYLGSEWLGLISVIVVDVWRMAPLATIIVLAGRMSIPEERFEQARIDGAGVFRSEERRVGKEWRTRRGRSRSKKKSVRAVVN